MECKLGKREDHSSSKRQMVEGSMRVGLAKQGRSRLCAIQLSLWSFRECVEVGAGTRTKVLVILFQVVRPWKHGLFESWDRHPESNKSFCPMDCCMIRAWNKVD